MATEQPPKRYVLRTPDGRYLSGRWVTDARLANALIFLSAENAAAYRHQEGYQPEWVSECRVCELTEDGLVIPAE